MTPKALSEAMESIAQEIEALEKEYDHLDATGRPTTEITDKLTRLRERAEGLCLIKTTPE